MPPSEDYPYKCAYAMDILLVTLVIAFCKHDLALVLMNSGVFWKPFISVQKYHGINIHKCFLTSNEHLYFYQFFIVINNTVLCSCTNTAYVLSFIRNCVVVQ